MKYLLAVSRLQVSWNMYCAMSDSYDAHEYLALLRDINDYGMKYGLHGFE